MKDGGHGRFSSYKYGKVECELPNICNDDESIPVTEYQSFCSIVWDFFTCGGCSCSDNESVGDKDPEASVTNEQYEDLKQAFVAFDWNNDGYIDSEDLGHVMKKLGHELSPKEVKKIFKDICKHRNGKLDFPDFVEMMAQDALGITTNENEILIAFQFIDTNCDGFITLDELKNRFRGCISDEEASRLMSEADTNGDGKIDFQEFKEMMMKQEMGIQLIQSEIELYS